MEDSRVVARSGGGIGCLTALGLIFIALKLAQVGAVASWSWWWVLAPFWIEIALAVAIFVFIVIVAILAS